MKVCKECKTKGIKSCDHTLAEGYGFGADDGVLDRSLPVVRHKGGGGLGAKFKEILHPRVRSGEFRSKGFKPNKSGYSGSFAHMSDDDVAEEHESAEARSAIARGKGEPTAGHDAHRDALAKEMKRRGLSPSYPSHHSGFGKKRGIGPRAAAVIEKNFGPSGKKFVPAKSGFGGTFEKSSERDAVAAVFRDLAERGPVVRPLPRMPHER